MPIQETRLPAERDFLAEVTSHAGRALSDDEATLALRLRPDKSAAMIARELDAAPVVDPDKPRPEHRDAATE